jgi:hypothetical protein
MSIPRTAGLPSVALLLSCLVGLGSAVGDEAPARFEPRVVCPALLGEGPRINGMIGGPSRTDLLIQGEVTPLDETRGRVCIAETFFGPDVPGPVLLDAATGAMRLALPVEGPHAVARFSPDARRVAVLIDGQRLLVTHLPAR